VITAVIAEAPPRVAKASGAVSSWLLLVEGRRLVPSHDLKAPPAFATRGSSSAPHRSRSGLAWSVRVDPSCKPPAGAGGLRV